MSSVNYTTIDRIIRINDVIREHLTLEENCSHSIREIIIEAFDDEDKKIIGSVKPTTRLTMIKHSESSGDDLS